MNKKSEIVISLLRDEKELKAIITEILLDLPEWFGIPESTKEYIEEGSKMPTFVAYIQDHPCGFVSMKKADADTLELYVIGVKKSYHRNGIGSQLIDHVENYAKCHNFSKLRVLTLDESYEPFDIPYDHTRKFYESFGFIKTKVDRAIWGENCPCLIMYKQI